ncbi:hypothetical protein TanjilG_07749 [Lupinus angustifolius]|uniref:Uncharacterized protein n=1 Tax=Lupinus angustifolius TaxID=3871 RepID=A0A1J7G5T7_LUPAN|nr:hypothetical protein TanjilG_07749 [Lupinus angustifolius]
MEIVLYSHNFRRCNLRQGFRHRFGFSSSISPSESFASLNPLIFLRTLLRILRIILLSPPPAFPLNPTSRICRSNHR